MKKRFYARREGRKGEVTSFGKKTTYIFFGKVSALAFFRHIKEEF